MRKSLIQRLKETGKRTALAGVIGCSMVLGGCEGPLGGIRIPDNRNDPDEDTAALGLALIGIGVGRNNPGAVAVGRAMTDYAGQKKSKSEQKVEIHNNGQNSQVSQGGDWTAEELYFSCNEIIDRDNNGIIDYPYDYKGIRKGNLGEFHLGEEIVIVGRILDPRAYTNNIDLIIVDENNNLVYKNMRTVHEGYHDGVFMKHRGNNNYLISPFYSGTDRYHYPDGTIESKLSPNEYSVYWIDSFDKELYGKIKFKILEKKYSSESHKDEVKTGFDSDVDIPGVGIFSLEK